MASEIVDGVRREFGPRDVETKAPYEAGMPVEYLKVPLNYDDLPDAAVALDDTIQSLPAHAWIKSATLQVVEAFTSAGLTTLDIGLIQSDGTVIDLDGIDAVIAKADIAAVGSRVLCNGALVANTAGIGANAAQVYTTTTTGPWTAGKAFLVIEYLPLEA